MEPLKKLGLAWLALIVIFIIVLFFYLFKFSNCYSSDFICARATARENHVSIYLKNNLYDVDIVNMTSTCDMESWNINKNFQNYRFELNKQVELNIFCRLYFTDMNISLYYLDAASNLSHVDFISVKR